MTVRGNKIYHCHGKDKGKLLGEYSSHKKASSVHRAIQAKKHKRDYIR